MLEAEDNGVDFRLCWRSKLGGVDYMYRLGGSRFGRVDYRLDGSWLDGVDHRLGRRSRLGGVDYRLGGSRLG